MDYRSSRFLGGAALYVLMLASAQAGPHFLKSDDPQDAEIRAVAKLFYTRIANGDAAGARDLFSGPPDQATLLMDEVRLAESTEKLVKSLKGRFGEEGRSAISLPTDLRERINALPDHLIIVNDKLASISNSGLLDSGLDLQRGGGAWTITHLTNRHSVTPPLAKFLTYLADAEDETRRGVDAGTLNTVDAVTKDLSPAIQRALDVWATYAQPPAKDEVTRPVIPARKIATPPLSTILDSFGQALRSDEIARLISALPGTPRISAFASAVYLTSEDCGVTFYFASPGQELTSVNFNGDGREGLTPYPGELPDGVAFWQTRQDVERNLGSPASSSGNSEARYHAVYPALGLQLEYGWCRPKDPQNPLVSVSLSPAPQRGNGPHERATAPHLSVRRVLEGGAAASREGEDKLPDAVGSDGVALIRVDRDELLDEKSFAEVQEIRTGAEHDQPAILLRLTVDGAAALKKISPANLHRRLAIVLDGKVLATPAIASPVSREIVIELPSREKPATAQWVGRLHAAVNAIPAR